MKKILFSLPLIFTVCFHCAAQEQIVTGRITSPEDESEERKEFFSYIR